MKDQLVEFKTAKLAKEKGFDQSCSYYYTHKYGKSEYLRKEHGKLKEFEAKDEYGDKIGVYYRKNSKGQPHIVIAPTQTLLQKWLREEYNIHIYIEPIWQIKDKGNNKATPMYSPWYVYDDVDEGDDMELYLTYEEALEIALMEALNELV
jgi:hypothetical protein